jgi:RNA polymerase sigma factor (sigma-70 family)
MDSSTPEAQGPSHVASDDIIGVLEQGRRRFLALVDHIRPDLHRYCTRMTGSLADGEDIVQETLARAYYELPQLTAMPPLRPWLFRIAHNRAIDHWRRESLRSNESIEAALEVADESALEPDNVLARNQAVQAAISCFLELAPAQRGCVILKDVLGHSIDEIADELNLSVPAVKAALHRGRSILQQVAHAHVKPANQRDFSPALLRYATLFNARDWDGVRAMLADDVRLDLVSRRKAAGRREVAVYFSNYSRLQDWKLAPAWLQGREVLLVSCDSHANEASHADYFIELNFSENRVANIRDFRHVSYISQDAHFDLVNS